MDINVQGWRVTEAVEFEGELYARIDDCDEGIQWYPHHLGGQYEARIEDEEYERLEAVYQRSKGRYTSGIVE